MEGQVASRRDFIAKAIGVAIGVSFCGTLFACATKSESASTLADKYDKYTFKLNEDIRLGTEDIGLTFEDGTEPPWIAIERVRFEQQKGKLEAKITFVELRSTNFRPVIGIVLFDKDGRLWDKSQIRCEPFVETGWYVGSRVCHISTVALTLDNQSPVMPVRFAVFARQGEENHAG